MNQQVGPAEETILPIAAGSLMSSSISTIATAESRRDGTVHHEQTGSPPVDIPQPSRQSRLPLLIPTPSSSQDESIISSSPAPSSSGSSGVGTPPSRMTPPSLAPFTNPQASTTHSTVVAPAASVKNSPSGSLAEEPYGTVSIQEKPNPTQPRQSTPSQPSPSPNISNSYSTPEGPGKPSPPPLQQQAPRENRSFWRRTVDGVSDWWGGSRK
jgi:hypothetical protein